MNLSVTFLGTGATAPTVERGVSALVLQRGPDRYLVDCGEGTQRQLLLAGIGHENFSRILLTHLHADHYLGLPGLLKTYAARGRQEALTIYGPPGTWMLLRTLDAVIGYHDFELKIIELRGRPGDGIYGLDGYQLYPVESDHRIGSLAWILAEDERRGTFDAAEAQRRGCPDGPLLGQLAAGEDVVLDDGTVIAADGLLGESKPGRKIVISGDTRPCQTVEDEARNADLLVHEATFLDDEQEEATGAMHSTAREAAELAARADVRLLALTHISSRYQGADVLQAAAAVFPRVVVPNDFEMIDVLHRETGEPRLEPLPNARRFA